MRATTCGVMTSDATTAQTSPTLWKLVRFARVFWEPRNDALEGRFVEPPWQAPLDAEREIRAMPDDARVRGLLIIPMLMEVKRRGVTRAPPRERYVAFNLYPLREHARVLVDTCGDLFPDRTLRQGLRKLGRSAPTAFGATTLGKVTLGSALGVQAIVEAFAKGYELNMQPGRAAVVECTTRSMIVSLDEVHHFVDSHHVGAFEGALAYAGVRGTVKIAPRGSTAADLLLEW